MYRKFVFGLITTAFLIFLTVCQPLFAQSSLGGILVYPNNLNLDFSSGKRFLSSAVMVENSSKNPVRVRAYIEDWDMREDGQIIFLETPDENSLNKYLKFNPREFDLQPGQKQLVRITAKLPEGTDGEYRSIIFFETVKTKKELVKKHKGLNLMVEFKTRFGVVLWAYKGSTDRNSTLKDFSQKDDLVAILENTGNIHTDVSGEITFISKNADKKEYKFPVYKFSVLPERSRQKRIGFDKKKLPEGNYTAKLYLTYKDVTDNVQVLEAQTDFTYAASKESIKKDLQVPVNEKIEKKPDNIAKPVPVDETEIKLDINNN